MSKETYEEFVEKFKPKKTTDDCYTPPSVYDAIADWVSNEYKLNKDLFARPFYPGGDYEHFDYKGRVVVDNPPFSILSKIIEYYTLNNIKFFLFAPTLMLCRYGEKCSVLPIGVSVEYENGARVNTSFVTNLEPNEIRARTSPTLYKVVDLANKANIKKDKKVMPKYMYPKNVLTSAMLYLYSKYGIDFVVPRSKSMLISSLDVQKTVGKSIFGAGWLISDELAAEHEKAKHEKAEHEKAERWELSERELKIIRNL